MRLRRIKEPSLFALLFTAISGTSLGLLLGVYLLLMAPARKAVAEPSEHEAARPGVYQAYYIPGEPGVSETKNLRFSLNRLARQMPGQIVFLERELNYFLSQFKAAETTGDGEAANVRMGSPNIRVLEEGFVLSLPLTIDPNKKRFDLTIQSFGHFEPSENGPKLVVDKLLLNSLPLPLGVGGSAVVGSFLSQVPLEEDLVNAWKAIQQIDSKDGSFVIQVGSAG